MKEPVSYRTRAISAVNDQLYSDIGGAQRQSGEPVPVVDPATGEVWSQAHVDPAHVDDAIAAAKAAFTGSGWADASAEERAVVLRRVGKGIAEHADALATYETMATGKTYSATRAEIAYAVRWYDYYASAIEVERERYVQLSASKDSQIREEPVGVVAAITPFNGAFSLGSWKFAPALAAGNTVIAKPPIHSSGSSLVLAEIMRGAGVPDGVFNVVLGDASEGKRLVADERVALVSFTGSTAVGEQIGAAVAGRMGRFLCEAGGKSAHIVMDDADLASAVIAAAQGVFSGSGQTCVAGSRLLVHERIYDRFLDAYATHAGKLVVGDPFASTTHLGPIATGKQYEHVRGMIDRAVAAGATPLLDGRQVNVAPELRRGYWVGPTILAGAAPDAEIHQDEVFGPVVAVQRIGSIEEAIELANATQYGLAAGIWTTSQSRARTAAARLQAGTVWINTYRGMDWRNPFGGYKKSGLGRENGLEALREFRQLKTVVQDYAPAVDPFALA